MHIVKNQAISPTFSKSSKVETSALSLEKSDWYWHSCRFLFLIWIDQNCIKILLLLIISTILMQSLLFLSIGSRHALISFSLNMCACHMLTF